MASPTSSEEVIARRKIRLIMQNVSTLKRTVSTAVEFIHGLPCRVIVKTTDKDDKKILGFYVGYNEDSDDKIAIAQSNIDFTLVHRKDAANNLKKSKFCYFRPGSRIHGFDNFFTWKATAKNVKKFIVENEMTLEADIIIHRPRTPSYYSTELSTGYYDLFSQRLTPDRSQVLFRFRVDNVMTIEREYSPTFYVRNIPWRIMAVLKEKSKMTNEMNVSKNFGVFLRCYGIEGTDNWACYANVVIDIWNHIPGRLPRRKRFTHFYYKDAPDYGFASLLSMEELTNEYLGHVNKGSVVIEASVSAEKPAIIPKRQPVVERPLTINNFVIPDALVHLYTLEDH
ncbi:uncharacterized protein LOC107362630 [Tetranychus urticae]|uniref:MATH domain-containing protein n=1 Tax=Tetranychus urticae TaxID=32264 RepID=T1KCD7_TETUR|nr:uncharacterized protein LOC107362630 [Tetranychus urticae]